MPIELPIELPIVLPIVLPIELPIVLPIGLPIVLGPGPGPDPFGLAWGARVLGRTLLVWLGGPGSWAGPAWVWLGGQGSWAGPAWLGGPRVLGRAGLVPKCLQMRHGFDNMFQNAFKCDMVSTTCSKMLSNATWFRQHVPKCSQMRQGFDNMFQNALKCDVVSKC